MSQRLNHQARPISTEYSSQVESYLAPPHDASAIGRPSDEAKQDESAYDGANVEHQYGSQYEATLNSPGGREGTMSSPGLESVQYMDADKESYRPGSYAYEHEHKPPPESEREVKEPEGSQKKRVCGMPLWLLVTLVALLIALAVGLGAGLGVGLSKSSR